MEKVTPKKNISLLMVVKKKKSDECHARNKNYTKNKSKQERFWDFPWFGISKGVSEKNPLYIKSNSE